jgi:hypothetical protein
MLSGVITHARSNVIAYLALCSSLLALAGGAYAAVVLPANSVGSRQIRKGSITPAKLNHRTIGGTILNWAQVNASGQIVSGSHGARELAPPNNGNTYGITWGDTVPTRCTVAATIVSLTTPAAGFPNVIKGQANHHTEVDVHTLAINGAPFPLPFSVEIIC